MLLVAGYARREHLREVEISKVEQLIKEPGAQFNVLTDKGHHDQGDQCFPREVYEAC